MTSPPAPRARLARPLAGVLALVGLLSVAVGSVPALAPAAPRGSETPAEVFSAARAMDELEEVAIAPRPVGSAEHARVRDHLVAVLDARAWRTEVHQAVGATDPGRPGTQPVALVRNVVAAMPGTDPTRGSDGIRRRQKAEVGTRGARTPRKVAFSDGRTRTRAG